ncbi:MAG: hypothetical protein ACI4QT_04970, partial [Kiritimatiellia bacterium]
MPDMDAFSIKEVFESVVLRGCIGALVAIGLACVGVWLSRIQLRVRMAAKRHGWPTVIVFGSMLVFAAIEITPTSEDKLRWRQQQQAQDEENKVYGMMYLGGMAPGGLVSSGILSDALASAGDSMISDGEDNPDSRQTSAAGQDVAVTPSIRSMTASDYASGVVLARIGTNEAWDFSAPAEAEISTDWLEFGAERDWFKIGNSEEEIGNSHGRFSFLFGTNVINALTVYSWGMARPTATNAATFFAPMQTSLGIVPAANWERLAVTDRPSQFWHLLTPSNTFVMTWQNVLLDRASDRPVSFQAEFEENGNVTFRYDLSRLAEDMVANLVVGISNDGVGRVFNALSRDTTTLKWAHLDPTRPLDNDPDGDGLSTEDEIFIYGTDPYRADTDMDGLSDGQEVNETSTDPLDPHSVDPRYPDGVAVVIGDVDPFSYPEGSTNTVWEHVFYTGTTNAPFAYPQSTSDTAVLRVTVSGVGSGELIVGDQVVPLLGTATAAPALLSDEEGLPPEAFLTNMLLVSVGKGVVRKLWYRKIDGLQLAIDSDDLLIGKLPLAIMRPGWIAFPHTDATIPCIHDLNVGSKQVSLVHGEEFSGLTATWGTTAQGIAITNNLPVSAQLYGSFRKSETRPISYRVWHPDILNSNTNIVFSQTLQFCPKLSEDDDDILRRDGMPTDAEYGGEYSCSCSSGVRCGNPWCDCGCACCGASGGETPADVCAEH